MSADVSDRATASVLAALTPLMAAVFVVFLITGLALPALPLHVHEGLGLGAFAVGLVAGAQFAASLVSRIWAGAYSDGRGAKGRWSRASSWRRRRVCSTSSRSASWAISAYVLFAHSVYGRFLVFSDRR